MSKLHIGSGKNYLPGWTNVDLFSSAKADLFCDMMRLPFPPKTFELIYACHVLEHSHRHTVCAVLHHWRELLTDGGTLRLAVPDFGAIVMWYLKEGNLDDIMGLLYGGQDYPLNHHTIAFDYKTLGRALTRVGFKDVRSWDWRTTEHADYDDFASAYLPMDPKTRKPMDKETGLLMSLNLQATK